jgi:hypothetical protein
LKLLEEFVAIELKGLGVAPEIKIENTQIGVTYCTLMMLRMYNCTLG